MVVLLALDEGGVAEAVDLAIGKMDLKLADSEPGKKTKDSGTSDSSGGSSQGRKERLWDWDGWEEACHCVYVWERCVPVTSTFERSARSSRGNELVVYGYPTKNRMVWKRAEGRPR